MKTEIAPAFDRKNEIKELFTEYTQMLIDGDSRFKEYLDIQNYDDKVKTMIKGMAPDPVEVDGQYSFVFTGGKIALPGAA